MTKTNKPLEFWLLPETGEISTKVIKSHQFPVYHVIEYSALQAAQDKIQQLEKENDIIKNYTVVGYEQILNEASKKVKQLEAKNKIMRDALERIHGMSDAILENATYITQETYASKIARQALKQAGEV